jgi:hypothetical protein
VYHPAGIDIRSSEKPQGKFLTPGLGPMAWLLDFLIGIGEELCPPWRRRSRAQHALNGALVLMLVALFVGWVV